MRTRAGKKAWNFERQLEEEKGEAITKMFRRNEGEMEKGKERRELGEREERIFEG
jgi:hypothetical protein